MNWQPPRKAGVGSWGDSGDGERHDGRGMVWLFLRACMKRLGSAA